MTQEAVIKSINEAAPPEETLQEAVARLAALPPLEYDRLRESEADKLGVRAGTLDKEVTKARKQENEEKGMAALFPDIEPWPHPINGAVLLDDIYMTVKRYIVCDDEAARAVTLWIVFTWFIDVVQVAPLAVITAPEKRCGKSQLLSLIGKLTRRPLVASNISPAAIFRVVEAHAPTLLIDEADTFLRHNEEARGIINSGHTRPTAYVIRTVGDDHEPKQFTTWGAKVICGIGKLPETLMDRAIMLELRRKLPHEKAERLRHADPAHFETLIRKLARFAKDAAIFIQSSRPDIPGSLNDRAQDNWEPLLAIADFAGDSWPHKARLAAMRLSDTVEDAVSVSSALLADIQEVFTEDRISSKELLDRLNGDDEKQWATYNKGKPITPRQLSNRLTEYGIKPEVIRYRSGTCRGFLREWFEDAFSRYLSDIRNGVTNENNPIITGISAVTHDMRPDNGAIASVTPNPLENNGCYVVTDKTGNLADMPDIPV